MFQHALLHRLNRIEITCSDDTSDCHDIFNTQVSPILRNKIDNSLRNTTEQYIRCGKNSKGTFIIKDNLQYEQNRSTIYAGGEECLLDYFSLVRYRLESQFVKTREILGRRCANNRGIMTGNYIAVCM